MISESRICQNCKSSFTIEPEDFAFYEKMEVPPPSFCPQCSMQRRIAFRNERTLYRRKDAFNKDIVSSIAPNTPFTVYANDTWWSDTWDPLEYGREYNFSKPFFQQFRELLEAVPYMALVNKNAVNSEYCNHSEDSKDCYLMFASIWNEGVLYSSSAINCKDSMDIFYGNKEERAYENIHCEESYNLSFSKHSYSCTDSMFLTNCSGCSSCFGCVNLRNKSYYIFNEPYSKKEYEKKVAEFGLSSFRNLEAMRARVEEFANAYPHKFAHLINSPGSIGDGLFDCKNCKYSFDVTSNVENCKYIANAGYNLKDSYHSYGLGVGELMYEVVDSGIGSSRVLCSIGIRGGRNVRYSAHCHNVAEIFGCVGLRNKNYCILNRQYPKEEYEKLLPRIAQHMSDLTYSDKGGRKYPYGEFFPIELSPFSYNETIAQEYFPLSKEGAQVAHLPWREEVIRDYTITKREDELPDDVKDISNSILAETVGCAHMGLCREQCTIAFRLIPREFQFYKEKNIPLPRRCPNCRHYARRAGQRLMKLWSRRCQCGGSNSQNKKYQNQAEHFHKRAACSNEFETSYAPDRPEIIYCEECYQNEIV